MSEYTPTTSAVCWAFADATALEGTWSDRTAAFGRWLAQHDAEVAKAAKVKALRDAAERLSDDPDDWMYEVGAKVWLLARADHIEAGEGA